MSAHTSSGAARKPPFKVTKIPSVNRIPSAIVWQPEPAHNPDASVSIKAVWHTPGEASFSDFTNFKIGRSIGRGTQAIVRQFLNIVSQKMFALKTTFLEAGTATPEQMFQRELRDMVKNIHHENGDVLGPTPSSFHDGIHECGLAGKLNFRSRLP
eukprot:RCo002892